MTRSNTQTLAAIIVSTFAAYLALGLVANAQLGADRERAHAIGDFIGH